MPQKDPSLCVIRKMYHGHILPMEQTDRSQCLLGIPTTPFSIYNTSETAHWTNSLQLYPSELLESSLGHSWQLFLWMYSSSMVGCSTAHLRNLPKTLGIIANKTASFLASLQKSLNSLRLCLINHIALGYRLAEQGGVWMVTSSTCCIPVLILSLV